MLAEGGHVKVRVTGPELPPAMRALEVLGVAMAPRPAETPGLSWIDVRIQPTRAAEVNATLAAAGIYASAIESGSDLESIFLALTATTPEQTTTASAGWGERG